MFRSLKIALAAATMLGGASGAAFAADKNTVAFVPQIIGIPYFNAMEAGGKRASAALGVGFVYSGPVDTNPVDQLQIVQNLIDQGVGAVSVSVLDASSLAPVVAAAKKKDVKLFTSDSDAPDSGRAFYVAQASDEGLGFTIIDEMVKRVGDHAKIGIVSGEATASNLNAWIGRRRRHCDDIPGAGAFGESLDFRERLSRARTRSPHRRRALSQAVGDEGGRRRPAQRARRTIFPIPKRPSRCFVAAARSPSAGASA
jgi:Periplasmic binding protein domain